MEVKSNKFQFDPVDKYIIFNLAWLVKQTIVWKILENIRGNTSFLVWIEPYYFSGSMVCVSSMVLRHR
jgi:hypothetical protein